MNLHRMWMEARAEILTAAIVGVIVSQVVMGAYVLSGQPAGNLPGTGDTIQNVVPATGDQGFNAETFCSDPETSVSKAISPDATGVTYEMKRVRDGVSETVTVVLAQTGDVLYAKHFYDQDGVQQSQPAFVDDDVKRCIEKKS